MLNPDTALLTISAWQRESSQETANRLLPLWQARKHLPQELRLQDQYEARLEAVRREMAR